MRLQPIQRMIEREPNPGRRLVLQKEEVFGHDLDSIRRKFIPPALLAFLDSGWLRSSFALHGRRSYVKVAGKGIPTVDFAVRYGNHQKFLVTTVADAIMMGVCRQYVSPLSQVFADWIFERTAQASTVDFVCRLLNSSWNRRRQQRQLYAVTSAKLSPDESFIPFGDGKIHRFDIMIGSDNFYKYERYSWAQGLSAKTLIIPHICNEIWQLRQDVVWATFYAPDSLPLNMQLVIKKALAFGAVSQPPREPAPRFLQGAPLPITEMQQMRSQLAVKEFVAMDFSNSKEVYKLFQDSFVNSLLSATLCCPIDIVAVMEVIYNKV